jgi:hypothetical protein
MEVLAAGFSKRTPKTPPAILPGLHLNLTVIDAFPLTLSTGIGYSTFTNSSLFHLPIPLSETQVLLLQTCAFAVITDKKINNADNIVNCIFILLFIKYFEISV